MKNGLFKYTLLLVVVVALIDAATADAECKDKAKEKKCQKELKKGCKSRIAKKKCQLTCDLCPAEQDTTNSTATNSTTECPPVVPDRYPCGAEANNDVIWCPGWFDFETNCTMGAEHCLPTHYNNSYYGASLGAAEVCPNTCQPQCDYRSETYCSGTTDDGCAGPAVCMPHFGGNGSCPQTCPISCGKLDIVCGMGYDQNGCWLGDYCMPKATRSPKHVGFDCPSVCYNQCDWNTTISCPMYDELDCFLGNTCVPRGTVLGERQDACAVNGTAAMRTLNREDHEMLLRDNSPSSVRKFYQTLMALR